MKDTAENSSLTVVFYDGHDHSRSDPAVLSPYRIPVKDKTICRIEKKKKINIKIKCVMVN